MRPQPADDQDLLSPTSRPSAVRRTLKTLAILFLITAAIAVAAYVRGTFLSPTNGAPRTVTTTATS